MSERWENGIYMIADTPKQAIPLLTESGDGDFELLKDYLYENGFELKTRDLEDFVVEADEDEISDILDTDTDP